VNKILKQHFRFVYDIFGPLLNSELTTVHRDDGSILLGEMWLQSMATSVAVQDGRDQAGWRFVEQCLHGVTNFCGAK
jgi:hypothetical protein